MASHSNSCVLQLLSTNHTSLPRATGSAFPQQVLKHKGNACQNTTRKRCYAGIHVLPSRWALVCTKTGTHPLPFKTKYTAHKRTMVFGISLPLRIVNVSRPRSARYTSLWKQRLRKQENQAFPMNSLTCLALPLACGFLHLTRHCVQQQREMICL